MLLLLLLSLLVLARAARLTALTEHLHFQRAEDRDGCLIDKGKKNRFQIEGPVKAKKNLK